MVLDTSGRWWRGTEFADISEYVRALTATGYQVADVRQSVCHCSGEEAELGVGFSEGQGGETRWITVGQRCARCGVLASFVDWKIDCAPTAHLRSQV